MLGSSPRLLDIHLWLLAVLSCFVGAPLFCVAANGARPNVIFILADDLGYGDVGCFGQKKIRTPHLDQMAKEGIRFTQHYAGNAVCAPSRCVLMTGKHPGHAWIRNNREVQPEGQPPIPAAEVTLAELLKQQGYATGAFGKWGLGFPGSEGDPLKQGFDRFFGYNCQRHAHNYYPTSLWDNEQRVTLNNPGFPAHQELPEGANPNDPASYKRYSGKDYAPDLIAKQLMGFIRENSKRPFFAYVPTTVPHLALQVPEDSLAEYRGQWEDAPYAGGNRYLPHPAPRAAYAAMITRMDREIGKIVALIRDLGLDENTIFIFSSDNGPPYNRFGATGTDFFESSGALRGRKGSLYEGGVRVPMIVRWKGRIKPGTLSERITGFEDWMPTILELVGAKGATPKDVDGISFAPTLLGQKQPARPFLYREFPAYGGQQSVRLDDWKGVRQNLNPQGTNRNAKPNLHVELYNLKDDPRESRDVSAAHPDIVEKIVGIMRDQHQPSPLFPFAALDKQ